MAAKRLHFRYPGESLVNGTKVIVRQARLPEQDRE